MVARIKLETGELPRFTQRIKDGLNNAMETGQLLAEVHKRKIYREAFATFRAYCETELGITDRRARQLMAFACQDGQESGTTFHKQRGLSGQRPLRRWSPDGRRPIQRPQQRLGRRRRLRRVKTAADPDRAAQEAHDAGTEAINWLGCSKLLNLDNGNPHRAVELDRVIGFLQRQK
jgi:hypothetical protein